MANSRIKVKIMADLTPEDEQFWDVVDNVIDVSNNAMETSEPGLVNSAMLYAAARYTTFVLASHSETRKDFIADTPEAIRQFSEEFQRLLEENMEDYAENYKVYMRDEEDSGANKDAAEDE